MTRYLVWAAVIVGALVFAWLVPTIVTRALMPSLEESGRMRARNWRGREVLCVLGVTWAVWALSIMVAGDVYRTLTPLLQQLFKAVPEEAEVFVITLFSWMPPTLALGALLFGFIDDVFGGKDKGFRGHVGALRSGRLTTGGLKMLGIGILSISAAAFPASRFFDISADPLAAPRAGWRFFLSWLLGALIIALMANTMNLLDLRPGRALKVFSVLAVPAAALWASVLVQQLKQDIPERPPGLVDAILIAVGLSIVLLGPVFASWRYDLGERAMLGDAGSNAMGAVLGFVLANGLPLIGLAVVAALLVLFNLGAERVSYSDVIDRVGPLRALDRLGRRDDRGEPTGAAKRPS